MSYTAPVDDIMLALKSVGGIDAAHAVEACRGLDAETIRTIIEEAARFGSQVLAPLNSTGDAAGCQHSPDGTVTTPPGWIDAYRGFVAGGWSALPCPEAYGGQDLPEIVSSAVGEIWNAANLSFGLCPLLTQGAIHALAIGGSDALKARYLPRLISGEWAGTMNLTEPQAGSDLSEVRTRAVPAADGTVYRLFGTKIFITYGEHDLTANIVHLVLARLPDAPAGTRGISLFLVPKWLVDDDGSLGARNDVVCTGLEAKLGIHASPTCVMSFGETTGAIGYLVGEPNRGLQTMFIMMNAARLAVGVQGVAVADRATQHATRYAMERRQGRPPGDRAASGPVAILAHADVRRMLLEMRAKTAAARMLCCATAAALDAARAAPDPAMAERAANRAALLTPVAKAFATDIACEVASLGVQVHGGMGFIEEMGAAQFYRDARILPIYEGTNGIQAIDLVTRKLPLAGGETMRNYLDDLEDVLAEVEAAGRPELRRTAERIGAALAALAEADDWMGRALARKPDAALAGATTFLRLFALAAGGCYLARAALVAAREPGDPARAIACARFFAEHLATAAPGLALSVMDGAGAILDCPPDVLRA
ncbi:MAG: acyl-CoA dehydrogenase family protein [Hyphomicrobiaceae bacterium]|nr:acyl-CoA dehydrogenase family protein [Hyphomicrobiaceae bacterium]